MNWKRRMATEWLWLMCTIAGVCLLWSVIYYLCSGLRPDEYWEYLFKRKRRGFTDAQVQTAVLVTVVYLTRLTIWAIGQVKKN